MKQYWILEKSLKVPLQSLMIFSLEETLIIIHIVSGIRIDFEKTVQEELRWETNPDLVQFSYQ